MNIVIATPLIFENSSPFNHLFKDIIGGFLDAGHHVARLVAVKTKEDLEYTYGYNESNISYNLYKRKGSSHNNVISRYIRDTMTSIRQAFGIMRLKNADILFEDCIYSSVWPVLAAKLKGIRIVLMVQDVWQDNAVQSGLIKKGSFLYVFFEFFPLCMCFIFGTKQN